ncbi:F-box/LRR-repeat protein 13-like [Bidens hawaiensis]|uniref:F-box/LRR-repeat protein 13-like n=1 Tax=Bidens hawaiensis TaxID=980011 RepID=UPI00404AF130
MFMKTRRLLFDNKLKRKLNANKLLRIKRRKRKTEHSSRSGDSVACSKKRVLQNVDGEVKDGQTLITGPYKNGVSVIRESKRTRSCISRKGIKGRKKRKMETTDEVDEIVEPLDQISELPEHIIHQILSCLRCPKDVTRITVWSKKWRSIFASFFSFDFDQKKFKASGRYNPDKFITFVNSSLAEKLGPMHSIQKFKVSLFQANFKLIPPMSNWINAALNKDVKELEIHVEENNVRRHYLLPNIVLTSKSLTSLKLYGCKFGSNVIINLCNLKELSIKNAHVNTDLINNFIQGCPSVEDLRLVNCKGIGHLHISTLDKLQRVHLHECHGLVSINIALTSLVSFMYWLKTSWLCDINLSGCENLKYLSIKDPTLTDEVFQDMLKKFSYLEKLVLRECTRLEQITILSKTLTELSIIRCKKNIDPLINAPNLTAFEFSGERIPFIPFMLLNISNLHVVKLHLHLRRKESYPFRDLERFLRIIVKTGGWKSIVSSHKNITIHEELPKFERVSSKKLKLELIKSPMKLKDFVDNLLRMSRPNMLSLVSSSDSELLNFLKEKIMSRERNPKCCTYYSRKCWLHHIKDVTMVILFEGAENGDEGHDLQQIMFKFNWKSSASERLELVDSS